MALYLNTNAAFKDFQMLRNDKYFVDKSTMIEKVNERIKTRERPIWIILGRFEAIIRSGIREAYPQLDDQKMSCCLSFFGCG